MDTYNLVLAGSTVGHVSVMSIPVQSTLPLYDSHNVRLRADDCECTELCRSCVLFDDDMSVGDEM